MPAVATHYLFGQDVYRVLMKKNLKIAEIIKNNKKDYNLGLQGPDPLFYFRPYSKNYVTEYGSEIHHLGGYLFLDDALEVLKKERLKRDVFPEYPNNFDRILAYILGFINHYTLDSNAHPVINELVEYDMVNHMKLEAELDREMLLRKVLEIDAKKRREKYLKKQSKKANKEGKEINAISTFTMDFYSPIPSVKPQEIERHKFIEYQKGLPEALKNIYPAISVKDIKESFDSFVKYTKMLYAPMGLNVKLLKLVEFSIGKSEKFSSLAITPKRYIDQVQNAREIIPIYHASIEDAVDNIANFWNALFYDVELSEEFDKSFS